MLNKFYWSAMGILGFVLLILLLWQWAVFTDSKTAYWIFWSIFYLLLTLGAIWLAYDLRKALRHKGFLTLLKIFLIAFCCFYLGDLQKSGLSYYYNHYIFRDLSKNLYFLIIFFSFFVPFILTLLLAYVADKLFSKKYPPYSIVKMTALIFLVDVLWLFYSSLYLMLFTEVYT